MRRRLFKSKIHRATVTQADLDYEGSVSIDVSLMAAADILPYEEVHVWNVTNGNRLVTYALEAPAGSGVICINGAAAHLCRPGDKVILTTFAELEATAVETHRPTVVLVDGDNRITDPAATEIPGPGRRPTRPTRVTCPS
jgi:aspartate 1-decarboxylase